MSDPSTTSKGVSELISRIRDEGVQAARQEAEELLRAARAEAAELTAQATGEAQNMRESAHEAIEAERSAALAALRHAARDAVLDLRSRVRSNFERHLRRLVSTTLRDRDFIRSIALVLAGESAEKYIKNEDVRIFLAPEMFDTPEDKAKLDEQERSAVLGIAGEVLREGIELVPATDVHAGARVRLVNENLEIDLTDEAISDVLLRRILPRYRQILEEA